jgi:creatinine amidohydrolase
VPVWRLADMTRDELRHRSGDVLVIPLGSTEQHGPHLPLGTDAVLASDVAEAAAVEAGERLDVVLAPTLSYGVSPHHVFAGAASVQADTYQRLLHDLVRSLADTGFSRVFLLNGHGGNHDSMGVVAKSAALDPGVSVAACSYWETVGDTPTAAGLDARDVPGHAGVFETSLVLALRPELVAVERAPRSRPDPPPVWAARPCPGVDVQLPGEWPRVDGWSDPSHQADASVGREMFRRVVEQVAQGIEHFAALTGGREPAGARP